MYRALLLAIAVVVSLTASAQKNLPLINSGEVIEKGKALYDSGKYDEAIKLYNTIPERDTNYLYMRGELALTYIAAKTPDKALDVLEDILKHKDIDDRANILRSRAIAADHAGKYELSLGYFQKALEEFPLDYSLHYNLGVTYYNHAEHEKATQCFFRVLALNPYHPGSHFNLGRIAIAQSRKTHAMLSLGIYLMLNENDNTRLVLLNSLVSNQVSDEGTAPSSAPNGCEKLDQIIRAKVALDKNFKSIMPLDAPVVKQFEMFFQQLSTIATSTDDPWVSFYLPLYKSILDQQYEETFLYHILTSTNNNDINKWKKKNDKKLKEFYSFANNALAEKRKMISAPANFGFGDQVVPAWFNDDGNRYVDALGKKNGDQHEGHWVYFLDNQRISAEGDYKNDKKIGVWKYYYNNGAVKSIENNDTGEITQFYENGNKDSHYFLKGDDIEGDAELYRSCGALKEKSVFKKGNREGLVKVLFPSGAVDVSYTYKAGELDGETISYFEDGKIYSKSVYKAGKLDGAYQQYYSNGKLKAAGNYVGDRAEGVWKYYHSNGVLEKEGSFKNDSYTGVWKFYDRHGVLTEESNYADGKRNGSDVRYHDGKKHFEYTYKNDNLLNATFFDKDGKVLGRFGNDKGNYAMTSYYATGEIRSEGKLTGGQMTGHWKFYYLNGKLESEGDYKDGQESGEVINYFKNGAKKAVSRYEGGELHGYHIEYFVQGSVKQEGWYQHDEREQQWLTYYQDGTVETDAYYIEGKLHGIHYEYNVDGKIFEKFDNKFGRLLDEEDFNSDGTSATKKKINGIHTSYEVRYESGKLKSQFEITCNNYSNSVTTYYPNGKISYTAPMLGNGKHGVYKSYYINGKPNTEGPYLYGSRHGLWKSWNDDGTADYVGAYDYDNQDSVWTYYFENGNISSVGTFLNDERQGITTYYSPDGKPLFQKMLDEGDVVAYRKLSSDGQWAAWERFVNKGSVTITYPYANGKPGFEETYVDGVLHGKRIYYFPDGKIFSEKTFVNGDYHGAYNVYYSNGKPREKGTYKYDALDGVYEYYNEDGSLRRTIAFTMGVASGPSIEYNKGVKATEYQYWAGYPAK